MKIEEVVVGMLVSRLDGGSKAPLVVTAVGNIWFLGTLNLAGEPSEDIYNPEPYGPVPDEPATPIIAVDIFSDGSLEYLYDDSALLFTAKLAGRREGSGGDGVYRVARVTPDDKGALTVTEFE